MHISFMLPVIEYASIVWDGCSEQDSHTLQKIQKETARLVTGLIRYVSLENMYKEMWIGNSITKKASPIIQVQSKYWHGAFLPRISNSSFG